MMTIDRKEKIRGIVYAYTQQKRYDMVLDLGVEWIRLGVPFPWKDKMHGTVTEEWEKTKKEFREAVDAGLKVMPSTPGMGGWGYDAEPEHNEMERQLAGLCRYAGYAGIL